MGKEAGAASGFRLRQSYAARTCRAKEPQRSEIGRVKLRNKREGYSTDMPPGDGESA